jgi:hypothetical protein
MPIAIYFSHSFVNETAPIYKIKGNGSSAIIDESISTSTLEMIKKWLENN